MDDHPPFIRLPLSLSNEDDLVASTALDDDEFKTHKIKFIQATFGYAAFLQARGRQSALSDAFLAVFVGLLEVLEANAPGEAQQCRSQLQLLLEQVFSKPDPV